MKYKNRIEKRFLFVLIVVVGIALGLVQTALAEGTMLAIGDIGIIGINTDGDDDFAFVFLKDVDADTSLYITDKGWNDDTGFYTEAGDGIWLWNTSGALSAGTVVHVKTTNAGVIEDGSLETSIGSISWYERDNSVFSYMGEQLFFYQGSEASPTFIAGATTNVEVGVTTEANWDGYANSVKTSALPDQLTNGSTAIWLYAAGPTERDNFKYNGTTSGTPAQLRAAIYNLSNWLVDSTNETAFTITDFPTFTVEIINTNPTITYNTGATVDEGATKTITQAMLQVTDSEQSAVNLTYTLTTVPANGTLYKSAAALSLSGTHTFTQADIDNALISYTHNGGETTSDNFKFTVSDGDGGSIAETTFQITVTPVNDAPQASSVQLSGTETYGQLLTGSYTYSDAEGDLQGSSTYKWYRADSNAGLNQTQIAGASQITYTLTATDVGKYIRFEVVPLAQTGTSPGAAALSAWSGEVQKADCDTATGVNPKLNSRTTSSVTLTSVAGYEYTRVAHGAQWDSGTWQNSTLFDGLSSGTTYDFYQRVKETDTHKASGVSTRLSVTTLVSPSITTASLPDGVTGQAYSQTLAATGTTPITWTVESGSLPAGVTLSGDTLSGTPTATGAFNFVIKAENTAGSDTQALSITVSAVPVITTASLPDGITGQAYNQALTATGTAPITWTVESGSLPTGLSLSGNTISGMPAISGTFHFEIKAENTSGSDTQAFSITVAVIPVITTTSLPDGITGQAYSQTLAAIGTTPITWTVESGSLPAGVTLSGDTLSGTPTVTGTSDFVIKAENTAGSDTQALSIAVSAVPVITTASLPDGITGQAYNQVLAATGTAPITWTVESGSLPTGLSLSGNTISGTPIAANTFNFTVKAENGTGNDTQAFTVKIADHTYTSAIQPSENTFPNATEGYGEQDAQVFSVTNTGTGQLMGLSAQITAGSGSFEINVPLAADTLAPGSNTTVSVRPAAGLAIGTYNGTLTISGDHGVSETAALSFTVTAAKTYTIGAAPDTVSFGSLAEGYQPAEKKLVTITNTGNQSITLLQPTALHYTVSNLSASVIPPAGTATFAIAPKDGLAAGNWDAIIRISGSNGASAQVTAAFTCTAPVQYQIIAGAGSSFHLGSSGTVTITSNGPFSGFTELTSNGITVSGSNYDVSEGSCVILLHNNYLNSLSPGTYTIRSHFEDGYAETDITVYDGLPQTGDNSPVYLYAVLVLCSVLGMILLKKKRYLR